MKLCLHLMIFIILSALSVAAQSKSQMTSMYTNLSGKNCRTVSEDKETGSTVKKCQGVGNFSLLVADDDNRMSLTVLSSDGTEHPLDLWTIVTTAFSTLGEKAEWRVVQTSGKVTPVALIVRVNTTSQENPEKPAKRSYLVVAKITPEKVCVTDTIAPSAEANVRARQFADDATRKACLTP